VRSFLKYRLYVPKVYEYVAFQIMEAFLEDNNKGTTRIYEIAWAEHKSHSVAWVMRVQYIGLRKIEPQRFTKKSYRNKGISSKLRKMLK